MRGIFKSKTEKVARLKEILKKFNDVLKTPLSKIRNFPTAKLSALVFDPDKLKGETTKFEKTCGGEFGSRNSGTSIFLSLLTGDLVTIADKIIALYEAFDNSKLIDSDDVSKRINYMREILENILKKPKIKGVNATASDPEILEEFKIMYKSMRSILDYVEHNVKVLLDKESIQIEVAQLAKAQKVARLKEILKNFNDVLKTPLSEIRDFSTVKMREQVFDSTKLRKEILIFGNSCKEMFDPKKSGTGVFLELLKEKLLSITGKFLNLYEDFDKNSELIDSNYVSKKINYMREILKNILEKPKIKGVNATASDPKILAEFTTMYDSMESILKYVEQNVNDLKYLLDKVIKIEVAQLTKAFEKFSSCLSEILKKEKATDKITELGKLAEDFDIEKFRAKDTRTTNFLKKYKADFVKFQQELSESYSKRKSLDPKITDFSENPEGGIPGYHTEVAKEVEKIQEILNDIVKAVMENK